MKEKKKKNMIKTNGIVCNNEVNSKKKFFEE